MNKGECVYCKGEIDEVNLRCYDCDRAFLEGMKLGEDSIKNKLKNMWRLING